MDPKARPKITISDVASQPLEQNGPTSTSTGQTPVREDARRTVGAVLARALRRARKL
jgi:hypothetical protein